MTGDQIVCFIFAGAFLLFSLVFGLRSSKSVTLFAMLLSFFLVLIGGINPKTLTNLKLEASASSTSLSFTRKQTEEALQLGNNGTTLAELKASPLVGRAMSKSNAAKLPLDYLLLATEASKENRVEDGLRDALTGLSMNPEDSRIKARLENMVGSLFEDIGATGYAKKYYDKSTQTDPTFSWPRINLGNLLVKHKRYDEAEKDFRKAINIDPKNPFAYDSLGRLLEGQKRYDEAEKQYRKIIELEPKIVAGYFNLGSLLEEQERYDEAEKQYRKIIELEPKVVLGYVKLGTLEERRNHLAQAEKILREGITIAPQSAQLHKSLGDVLNKQGKQKEALEEYKEAKSLEQ